MKRNSIILACLMLCLLLIAGAASADTITVKAAHVNDLGEALKVTTGQTYVVKKASGATIEAGEPSTSCGSGVRPSVWFKYRADRAVTVTADTQGTNFRYPAEAQQLPDDTVISIYKSVSNSGSESIPANLAHTPYCNDDAGSGSRFSKIDFVTEPGVWYYIRVTPYTTTTLPDNGKIKLTMSINELLAEGDWQLKGPGIEDDVINCDEECYYNINHSPSGRSMLVQNINTFQGVNIPVGSQLQFWADAYMSGETQKYLMTLTVNYTDGTSVTMIAKTYEPGLRTSEMVFLKTKPLTVTKPVASINVMFKDWSKDVGFISLSDLHLRLIDAAQPVNGGAPILPMPVAPSN